MNKQELLKELNDDTWVMLRPSQVEGIGVFAIRDIPKGCRTIFSKPGPESDWITISRQEIDQLPASSRFLVENYCLFDDDVYYLPAEGFKKTDLVIFLNHADVPNLVSINDGEYFEALRDISAGEELFIDYGTIVDHRE